MTLADAAQQLYALVPGEFVAARDALAAEVRRSGDRDLADRIRRLPRAAPAAWAVDLLARDDAGQGLAGAAALGDRFRAAQAGGDRAALATLADERKATLAQLLARGRELAEQAGAPLAGPAVVALEQTLRAVVADADAAEAARSGVLVRPLAADGLEPADLDGAVAGEAVDRPRPRRVGAGAPGGPEPTSGPDRRSRQRDARRVAREELRRAEQAADRAEADRDEVESRVAELDDARDRVADDLRRLRDEFAAAEARRAELDDRERFLRRERRRAVEDAAAARREAERAREALEGLDAD
ncbi:hypothetical protein [Frigoribacterium sp. CFBP 13707]|uniref:hypothetical protein n=1 Tax=Frigoribacterium sp. CFBP 13707 TaxID=2775313 RepID=UPI0017851DF1|nr:hypothetical protein [Frigoribacterium sp. CFBP 13707]MBD8728943.1 hypothetical protein [Frigoribacterium sp. CFBP 13707]